MIYTYWGNKNEQTDGTSVIRIASGEVPIGGFGDFTDFEYQYLSQDYILVAGIEPWNRFDFFWEQENQLLPGRPVNVQASPHPGGVSLTWEPPYAASQSAINNYLILVYINGIAQIPFLSNSSIPNYVVSGLTDATARYSFSVAAKNIVGVGPYSLPSSEITFMANVGVIFALEATLKIGDGVTVWEPSIYSDAATRNQDIALSLV